MPLKQTFPHSAARHAARLALAACFFASWTSAPAPALAELASPVLVQDFAPGLFPLGVAPQNLKAIGGRLLFSGQDAASGSEPWVSEGSAASTRFLADLCPGYCSSSPRDFTQLDEAILFHGLDRLGHSVVYRLEADEVREIFRPADRIAEWVKLGAAIYFRSGAQIFRSDGTRAGTAAIADFQRVSGLGVVTDSFGEALYFADSGTLFRLAAGGSPQAIAEIGGGTAGSFTTFSGGRFVFQSCGGLLTDCHAYVSDGTAAGTYPLEPQAGGNLTAAANHFLVWQGRVYFETSDGEAPFNHIVSSDGTAAGTRRESPIGAETSGSFLLAATASHLYYVLFATDGSRGNLVARSSGGDQVLVSGQDAFSLVGELNGRIFVAQKTNGGTNPPSLGTAALIGTAGTVASTSTLAAIIARPGGVVFAGQLYFAGGSGLWRTDGSAGGTAELALGLTTPASSSPRAYPLGSRLVVQTTDNSTTDDDAFLHQVDPASLATAPVAADPLRVVAAGAAKALLASSELADARLFGYDGTSLQELPAVGHPQAAGVGDDDHFFFFTDVAPGQSLWESDGTAAGTLRRLEFLPSPDCGPGFCGNIGQLTVADSHVFFYADRDGGPGHPRLSLWDRDLNEKRVVREPIFLYPFPTALPAGRALFIQPLPGPSPDELWISDGTAAGTGRFFVPPTGFKLQRWAVAGTRLFVVIDNFGGGLQALWRIDFATAEAFEVLPAAEVLFTDLVAAGNHLYFVADNGNGAEPGFSDGTTAGTRLLDLRPGAEGSMPAELFALADGRVAFAAAGDEAGYELWISNGHLGGTFRLTDLNPGGAPSSPHHLTQAGNRLFFAATEGLRGEELWALDLPERYGPCPEGRTCVLGGRFEVSVTAHTADGDFLGRRAAGTAESGVFTFFSENNWEMLVKVLDGCAINQKRWVFAAAATDVAFTLTVTDRETGTEKVYDNPSGQAARAITDTAAFSCN